MYNYHLEKTRWTPFPEYNIYWFDFAFFAAIEVVIQGCQMAAKQRKGFFWS